MGYPQKIFVIIFIFFIFALLQNSFFTHFSFLGSNLNLVFILFFILLFFYNNSRDSKPGGYAIFLAVTAGIFSDVILYTYIGPSVVVLLFIGFLMKRIQESVNTLSDKYPYQYFLPIFILCFIVYQGLLMLFMKFFDPSNALMFFNLRLISSIIYNSIFASIGFLIYKRICFYAGKI